MQMPIDAHVNRTQPSYNLSDYIGNISNNTNEEIRPVEPLLNMFRFTILRTGEIGNYTIIKKMEKTTVGLYKSFVKMFSPTLIKSLYTSG